MAVNPHSPLIKLSPDPVFLGRGLYTTVPIEMEFILFESVRYLGYPHFHFFPAVSVVMCL